MRKSFLVVALAALMMILMVSSAFAEGYNNVAGGASDYTRAKNYFSGPHGGYATTTNKCADCHSTHYASGSYMLLRASSREAACDYCHGGGGGSTINIMMDNTYKANNASTLSTGIANADTGKGTGHTLGYKGMAPGDIKPAYSSDKGFACFDCHSPHGNSARILTTFSNPGRALGTGPSVKATGTVGALGNSDGVLDGIRGGTPIANDSAEWGIDPVYGNFKWISKSTGGVLGPVTWRPIWPSGRFLLLKNPHKEAVADTVTADPLALATDGVNKYKIDWDEPLGPADDTYGGGQDNDNDKKYPFAPQTADRDGDGKLEGGFLAESEFCTDCHDGMSGASTQKAEVYQPGAAGDYVVAYSHDAQPRH